MDLQEIPAVPIFTSDEIPVEGLTEGQKITIRHLSRMEKAIEWGNRHTLLSFNLGVQLERQIKALEDARETGARTTLEENAKFTRAAFWKGVNFIGWIIATAIALLAIYHK